MKTTLSEITIQRLLELVKAALHGTAPDENLFTDTSETDWNELFEQSVNQGVMVLSLEGAMQLPKELQPPLALKLRWIASVEAVEKRYRRQLEIAKDLSSRFREKDIKMMLFKGIALSRLYPIPASREFGDIDIFLCGKAKEGDALLKQASGKKLASVWKHVNFSCQGILIENHHTFLNHVNDMCFQESEYLEKQLIMKLAEAGIMGEAAPAISGQTDGNLLFPPPGFDALYVILHLLTHLPKGIVLRYLCDLTVLFKAYRGKIDFSFYRNTLSEAGLLKLADIFVSLTVRYLGLDPEYAPPYETDLSLENRLWNDILNPEVPPLPKEKRKFLDVLIYKIRILKSGYWKSELVFPGQFGKMIFYSTFFHLLYPGTIGKFK